MLAKEKLEVGKLFEDPLADQACRVGHGDLRAGHAHFQIIGGETGGSGCRGDACPFRPKMDTHGQPMRFAGGIDRTMDQLILYRNFTLVYAVAICAQLSLRFTM